MQFEISFIVRFMHWMYSIKRTFKLNILLPLPGPICRHLSFHALFLIDYEEFEMDAVGFDSNDPIGNRSKKWEPV
ncbi:hypothetical protein J23TS9_13110 [Paenibacillus sp. J23TS9]|nr:hypothetical protein J23TS9_13110 [Paenibacillus sp. J23TS9]